MINKKYIITLMVFDMAMSVFSGSGFAIPDPSAVYCSESGYKYEITNTTGQYGVCVSPDGTQCNAWHYYCKCEPNASNCMSGNYSCDFPCKNLDCKKAGERILVSECCEGLKKISPKIVYDNECNALPIAGPFLICSDCGNGICENWESKCNCPDDCKEEQTCTDTDGGEDIYEFGICKDWRGNYSDKCVDDNNILIEYYCSTEFNQCISALFSRTCPNGCKDGACIKINKTEELPDLTIKDIWYEEKPFSWSKNNFIFVKLCNIGAGDIQVENPEVNLEVNEEYAGLFSGSKSLLTAGKCYNASFSTTYPLSINEGYYSVKAIADYSNKEIESNENNNYMQKEIYIYSNATNQRISCGDKTCNGDETFYTCPEDCGHKLNPYDADVKSCRANSGKVYPTTGKDSASWFVWNGCTKNKFYRVNPNEELVFRATTDRCANCVCTHPNFYVYEYEDDNWVEKKYFDLPDEKGIRKEVYYTPTQDKIKIHSSQCFYLYVYSENPVVDIYEAKQPPEDNCTNYYICPDGTRVKWCQIVEEHYDEQGNVIGGGCACKTNPELQCPEQAKPEKRCIWCGDKCIEYEQNIIDCPAVEHPKDYKCRLIDEECKTIKINQKCVGEEGFIYEGQDVYCCEGLRLIKTKNSKITSANYLIDLTSPIGICTAKCGNGICDEKTETNYNCPEDCKKSFECETDEDCKNVRCKGAYCNYNRNCVCPIGGEEICKNSCQYKNKCIPFGTRVKEDGFVKYCSIDEILKQQKKIDESCRNNYECVSNVCVSEKCLDVEAQLGFLKKLWCKVINLFDKERYENCLIDDL